MSADPLVSVCVPCHNAEPYVGQALDSLFDQTWSNIEVIVVNDSSTDGSLSVLKRYSSPRLHVINADFGSASKSRNCALDVAQGDWIKFFDADDLLHPQAIERQLDRIRDRFDAVASSPWGRFFDDNINTFRLSTQSVWRDMPALDWLVESWRDAQPMTQPGMFLIPRPLLNKVGGWDESLSLIDDFEFFARLISHAQDVLFAPNSILYYRSGLSSSLSGQKTRDAIESAFWSLLRGTDHLLRRRADVEARLSCANVLQQFIYDVYPMHRDLREIIQGRIVELGGSDLKILGGPRFHRMRRIIGWRAAKHVKRLLDLF